MTSGGVVYTTVVNVTSVIPTTAVISSVSQPTHVGSNNLGAIVGGVVGGKAVSTS